MPKFGIDRFLLSRRINALTNSAVMWSTKAEKWAKEGEEELAKDAWRKMEARHEEIDRLVRELGEN